MQHSPAEELGLSVDQLTGSFLAEGLSHEEIAGVYRAKAEAVIASKKEEQKDES